MEEAQYLQKMSAISLEHQLKDPLNSTRNGGAGGQAVGGGASHRPRHNVRPHRRRRVVDTGTKPL